MAPTTSSPAPATRVWHTFFCFVCSQQFRSLNLFSEAFVKHQQAHHDAFTPDAWEM